MSIQIGDMLPIGQFQIMGENGPEFINVTDFFAGKKVVLFAVPGAFTPTCSVSHLPGFVAHADAFKDARAKGASVWVLSPRGASGEVGRWLARKENSADLIGGVGSVSLEDKDDVLAGVLLDMSMTASRADSRQVAGNIHKNISKFARMHKPSVEQAGFVVLKSPDIPSLLVETGFISNPGEARKLKTRQYQRKMAQAIHRGITSHFARKPPMMTYVAETQKSRKSDTARVYKVVRGDTLSVIASRNGVPLKKLRAVNKLKNDRIRIGQVLNIPSS